MGFFCIFVINKINHMKKYKVVKAFFKLSEQKNYEINDTIELSEKDAKAMDWYVVEIKEDKPKSKK